MKIIDRNMKQGQVKVIVDSADDLWYVHTIVDSGDLCTGDSEYKYKVGGTSGGEGKTSIIKKKVWVAITVEKSEFSGSTGQLRISGKVMDGSEDVPRGSYHTLDITQDSRLTIAKTHWHEYQLEKLNEAANASAGKTIIVLFDREQAQFILLKPQGHEILLQLKGDVPRKGVDEGKQHAFYREIATHAQELVDRWHAENIICASPSFWKEYLEKDLPPVLRKKAIFAAVSAVDETAVGELLKRPELQQALRSQRSTRESQLIEKILEALAKDRLIYGLHDLQVAVAEGNISSVTISERKIAKEKEDGTLDRIEKLLRTAGDMKAAVHLVSTDDAMRKVDGLGGIVGMKRW